MSMCFFLLLQTSMNVQALKQTDVMQTLYVATRKVPTYAAVSVVMRAMEESAQVNIFSSALSNMHNLKLIKALC